MALLLWISGAVALSPISVKGTKFFDDEGQQFFIKGVAYQPGGATQVEDPLANATQCQTDAGFMKDLGTNTVRVYTVDPTADHDGCMQAFASQGIYVWLDVTTPTISIQRTDPQWTIDAFNHYASVIDAFAKYNNTLVFTVANEVINDVDNLQAAPYVKAAARDLKAFRKARGYRKIPIAYSSADIVDAQSQIADYFACGDAEDAIEVFGLNTFAWCGNSSYSQSGYDTLYTKLQPLNIPAVFTETGCNTPSPRTWDEVSVMLGSVFPNVFSGVIVYEWAEEENNYGLIAYPSNSSTGGFPSPLADYDNLQRVLSTVSPVSTSKADYTPSNTPPACPSDSTWTIDGSAPLPTIAELKIDTVTARTTYIDPTAAETTGSSATGSQTGTSTGSAAAASGSQAAQGAQGLSTGAVAGIAVGAVVIGLALIAGAFILFRRRQRSRLAAAQRQSGPMDASVYNDTYTKSELSGISAGRHVGPKPELEGNQMRWHQPSRNAVPAEMEARQRNSRFAEVEGHVPTSYYEKMGSSDESSSN